MSLRLRITKLGAFGGVKDARRLRADGGPAGCVELLERGLRRVGQAGDGRLEERGPFRGLEVGREGRVDPADPVDERVRLLVRDRDRLVGREVELERDGGTRLGLRLVGERAARERDRLGSGDVLADELADPIVDGRRRQQVDRHDRGQQEDQDGRRDGGAGCVVAGESRQDGRALREHQ